MRAFVLQLLCVVGAALPSAAGAEGVARRDLSEPVPGTSVTYLDLARQIMPDISQAGNRYEAKTAIAVRHIGGADMQSEPELPIGLDEAVVLPIQSDGKDRLLVLFDLGLGQGTVESFSVLALFNLADVPKLLDAADIGYDRFTYFRDPPELSLGEGKAVVLTDSGHFNSSQGYLTTAIILVRNDQLQLVDSVFTFKDAGCGFERTQTLEFSAGDRDGRAYSDIVATVTEATVLGTVSCEGEELPKDGSRQIRVTYRWDEAASRFVPDSNAFGQLAEENETRF